MPDSETAERIRKLELRLSYLTGAAVVAGVALVAFMGVTSLKTIPTSVDEEVRERVGEEAIRKISEAEGKASKILEADAIQETLRKLPSFREVTLTAKRQVNSAVAAVISDSSAEYVHILDDPSCFLVAMRLPTASENPQWPNDVADEFLFGTTQEIRKSDEISRNLFPRHRRALDDAKEVIRIFSLVLQSETPVPIPDSVNFKAIVSCGESS